jgi:hypothetical protein
MAADKDIAKARFKKPIAADGIYPSETGWAELAIVAKIPNDPLSQQHFRKAVTNAIRFAHYGHVIVVSRA